MKDIPVKKAYQIMGSDGYPSGPLLFDATLADELQRRPGTRTGDQVSRVVDIQTRVVVYRWNHEKWQWDAVNSSPPADS
jgi:hypothetical protein